MDIKSLGKSWLPTAFGFAGAVLLYFSSLGPNLPTTGDEWGKVLVAACLAGLGMSSKQFNVTNAARPVMAQTVPGDAPIASPSMSQSGMSRPPSP